MSTSSIPAPDEITQRVRRQVDRAVTALRLRDSATLPRLNRRSGSAGRTPEGRPQNGESRSPEERALRAVYRELGDAYRAYRLRTGQDIAPPVRSAAAAFRRQPSLESLVPVAGYLDELKLLDW